MITITNFSYKGGAGRTVASANIAAALAAQAPGGAVEEALNYKVALIDLDVFSAGTHRVFEIKREGVERADREWIQNYLLEDMTAREFVARGGLTVEDELMARFREVRGGHKCRPDFTLFPASPTPDSRFIVQKYHEHNMLRLINELTEQGFDYAIIDGESGTRSMADIAVRLADVVLIFFRLTWQHIEGSLVAMADYAEKRKDTSFYLIPTCVPLVGEHDAIYQPDAPGLDILRDRTENIPIDSDLNSIAKGAAGNGQGNASYGYFWSRGMCIHDSLTLKGEERVIVYDRDAADDQAAKDYYQIAAEISRLHHPARFDD